jgi:predicted transcriptional regulator
MFELPKDFDPYKDLVELKNFAVSADTHIGNLLKNEKEIVKAINELSEAIKAMKKRAELMEKVLDEIARTQR